MHPCTSAVPRTAAAVAPSGCYAAAAPCTTGRLGQSLFLYHQTSLKSRWVASCATNCTPARFLHHPAASAGGIHHHSNANDSEVRHIAANPVAAVPSAQPIWSIVDVLCNVPPRSLAESTPFLNIKNTSNDKWNRKGGWLGLYDLVCKAFGLFEPSLQQIQHICAVEGCSRPARHGAHIAMLPPAATVRYPSSCIVPLCVQCNIRGNLSKLQKVMMLKPGTVVMPLRPHIDWGKYLQDAVASLLEQCVAESSSPGIVGMPVISSTSVQTRSAITADMLMIPEAEMRTGRAATSKQERRNNTGISAAVELWMELCRALTNEGLVWQ